ncbi:MAG: hypothetical protein A2X94_08145 [Bdellovibrionales bacterium GWB1_55_8]|nr:MAG: hypothetical protein A2X94_08145 [Bdellovibrionales bacterium GWB1_55_8]
MNPGTMEILATVIFSIAVAHTFLCSRFQHLAGNYPEGSIAENVFHLLGEVEIVFGLWAGVLVIALSLFVGTHEAVRYTDRLNFTEPLFVFAIMAAAATRPVIDFATRSVLLFGRILPLPREFAVYFSALSIAPLFGSFITEPAAMTVTALILRKRYYEKNISAYFKYITLAVLFVNVSIGGVLTPYAAPPVLMVAGKWNFDLAFMLGHFGWKSAVATMINAFGAAFLLRKELGSLNGAPENSVRASVPIWLTVIHLLFLGLIVISAHHPVIFLGIFMFFLGVATITREYQDELKIRESLLVAFFLGGLVVLGGLQAWWLEPLIRGLDTLPLFLGATALTAFTDNAALTYLGSQVPNVSDAFKYALVGGAIAGGGLTVIANAPNPAGYSILQDRFGPDGISPAKLALAALVPTLVAMACLWLLPSF